MLAGKSGYPSRRSNTLRFSERDEDCKRIELWRSSLYMGAEGESVALQCESLRQKDKEINSVKEYFRYARVLRHTVFLLHGYMLGE